MNTLFLGAKAVRCASLAMMLSLTFGLNSLICIAGDSETERLTCKLHLSQTTYLIGEPVSLVIELINETQKPIGFVKTTDPTYGDFVVCLSEDGKNYINYGGLRWGLGDRLAPGGWYQPGETLKVSILLVKARSEHGIDYLLSKPGKFFVRASVLGVLHSDPVVIEVKKPQGEDAFVWEQIKNTAYGPFVEGITSLSSLELKLFQDLTRKYSRSIYSSYIAAALAKRPLPPKANAPSPTSQRGFLSALTSFDVAVFGIMFILAVLLCFSIWRRRSKKARNKATP